MSNQIYDSYEDEVIERYRTDDQGVLGEIRDCGKKVKVKVLGEITRTERHNISQQLKKQSIKRSHQVSPDLKFHNYLYRTPNPPSSIFFITIVPNGYLDSSIYDNRERKTLTFVTNLKKKMQLLKRPHQSPLSLCRHVEFKMEEWGYFLSVLNKRVKSQGR